jgi:hypothetical protein
VPADASVEQLRGLLLQYSPKNQLSSTAVRWPESNSGAKHVFLELFYTELIVLPRQTRDKHKEIANKGRFLQARRACWSRSEAAVVSDSYRSSDMWVPAVAI